MKVLIFFFTQVVSLFYHKKILSGLNLNTANCKNIFGLSIPKECSDMFGHSRVYLLNEGANAINGPSTQLRCIKFTFDKLDARINERITKLVSRFKPNGRKRKRSVEQVPIFCAIKKMSK